MEKLIKKISAGHSNEQFFGSNGLNKSGLDVLYELKGIEPLLIDYLFAIYIGNNNAKARMLATLLIKAIDMIDESKSHYGLKIASGALECVINNEYRAVDCYKCNATGIYKGEQCPKCNGIGKTSRKPKEYQLCNINRNTWWKKEHRDLRLTFDELVNYLFSLDGELRSAIGENSR